MSKSNGLSFLRRFFLKSKASPRRGKSRSRFMPEFLHLEDRCVPSTNPYVVPLPNQGTVDSLSKVMYTPASSTQITAVAPKLVTIMNNSTSLVYPILYDANTTPDETFGKIVRIVLTDPGEGYSGPVQVQFQGGHGSGATATVGIGTAKNGLANLALVTPGSNYLPTDQDQVTINFKMTNGGNPTRAATAKVYVSQATAAFVDSSGVGPALYDKIDPYKQTYRGYIGEYNPTSKQYELGLKPGDQVTVMIPPVMWDGGRLYFATNGPVPITSATDPGNPLQNTNPWFYDATKPSYVMAPSDVANPRDYSANFTDPGSDKANSNGVVMWYHDTSGAHDFGFGAPAQLTEWTFRDPNQPFNGLAPDMPTSQVLKLVNYDVSYVDNLSMSASMEATNVDEFGTDANQNRVKIGSGNYAWVGADLSLSQQQAAIAAFTSNNLSGSTVPAGPGVNGLGTYFGGLGWDQYFLPPSNSPSGPIYNIANTSQAAVRITLAGNGHGGALHDGMYVNISGVTAGQTAINGLHPVKIISNGVFDLTDIQGNGQGLTVNNPTYVAQTTGIPLEKLPSGYQAIADSPNVNSQSSYDSNQFTLLSGGVVARVDTFSSGVATKDSNQITSVLTDFAKQLVAGMLWSPDGGYFPTGTTIADITLGTAGQRDSTITMSNKALKNGPNNGDTTLDPVIHPSGFVSWTFIGSQYTSTTGSTDGNNAHPYISGVNPSVGLLLRPKMLVQGQNIAPDTYVGPFTGGNYSQVNLVKKDGTPITTVPTGTGTYTFIGAPDSYIVQKLIDVWYAWADYYVRNQTTPLPAQGVTFNANAYGPNNPQFAPANYLDPRTDPNALILYGFTNLQLNQLDIGDVVTGPGLTANATLNTANYDPSLNYTVTKINNASTSGATDGSVELSLPITAAQTNQAYKFTAPQFIARSSDAPIVPPTAITTINNTGTVTISTASSAGLANGVQVTISGVMDQQTSSLAAINGKWTIAGVNTNAGVTTFQLVGSTGNGHTLLGGKWSASPGAGATAGTIPYTLNFTGAQAQADALQFSRTVYDVMQSMSLLTGANPQTILSKSALLINEIIGGNVGDFTAYNDLFFKTGKTNRPTTLPHDRTHFELRDEIKSVLRGVYSFTAAPDQSKWYPDPAVGTPGATLDTSVAQNNPQAIDFGVKNLDPYVWFIHVVLKQSGYGFSLDDDVSNVGAVSNSLEIAFGGNAYTAPLTNGQPFSPAFANLEAYSGGAPFGNFLSEPLSEVNPKAYIDVTSSYAIDNAKHTVQAPFGMTTISGLSRDVVAKLVSSVNPGDPTGAFITSPDDTLLPKGATVALITSIAPKGGVDNQSWVSFKNPDPKTSNWTPPSDRIPKVDGAKSHYTFTGFTTKLPAITSFPSSGNANTPLLITGSNFTGASTATINTMNAPIIKGAITLITNTNPNPVTITTVTTQAMITGLADGDTVTISGVIDQVTGLAASINKTWKVAGLSLGALGANTTFQLQGSTGDGHTLSQSGDWIDGSDSVLKVIIPTPTTNTNGSTYPGPKGKIGVRNSSGTNYSDSFFTVGTAPSNGPHIQSLSITHGPLTSSVTINGTGFQNTSDVTFNVGAGITLGGFQVNADYTQVTVTIPYGATGTGTFTVTAGGLTDTSVQTFQVDAPTLALSNPFSVTHGTVGSKFTITGNNFFGADQFSNGGGVLFNTTPATRVQVLSNTQLEVFVPTGLSPAGYNVSVKTSAGTSGTSPFTVDAFQTPTITSSTPNSAAVGALITLTGTHFTGTDQPGGGITVNGAPVPSTDFAVVNDTTISLFVPSGATTTGNIVVTTPGGSTTPGLPFTVTPAGPPTITGFTPTKGDVNTPVTITGTNFTLVDDVQFGPVGSSIRADDFFIQNDATILAYVPIGATTGPIRVHNNLGWATSATNFGVGSVPVITKFLPPSGPVGRDVQLTGSGFTNVVEVRFNGTLASKWDRTSDLEMTATVPVGATTGRITVSTSDGNAGSSDTDFIVQSTVAFALSAVDRQIYKRAFDTNAQSPWTLTAAQKFTAVAVGSAGASAAPIAFGVNYSPSTVDDKDVYVAHFTVDGGLVDGWSKVAPGNFTSIAVGAIGTGGTTPILFGLGADQKAYAAVFNANGALVHGWFLVAPGTFTSLTVGQYGVAGNPELFAVGTNQQVYAARFNASGGLVNGFFPVAPGAMSSVTVASRGNGTQELFGLGINQRIYAATLDANGNLAAGWFATKTTNMGSFSALTAVTLGGGNLGVYALGTDSKIYTGTFSASNGAQLSGWTSPAPGQFSTLAAQTTTAGRSLVLGVESGDSSVDSALFDADGNYISGWMETGTGKFSKVALAPR
jgi:hypothetical protein